MSGLHRPDTPVFSKVLDSAIGPILIQSPTPGDKISNYKIDEGIKAFRPAWRQKEALAHIAEDAGWVVTAVHNDTIIGYTGIHPAGEFERWGTAGIKEIIELGAIEVAPGYRGFGLAKELMKMSFPGDVFEDYIVLATEYSWHWDLEGTHLNVWDYQKIMKSLMEGVGMVRRETDDPEIREHPANMLMVRVGSRVSAKAINDFENLLFTGEED